MSETRHYGPGSDEGGARWATLCSLIETYKMNDVEPYAYLHDVLQRMVDGHPVNRLDELLPWNWKLLEAANSTRNPPRRCLRGADGSTTYRTGVLVCLRG